MLNIVKWWVHIVKGSKSILSVEPCLESKLWTSPGREHGSLKISPTRTCVEIELPPSVPFIISLLAFRPLQPSATKSFLHVESRSNWASCIVGPYRFKDLQTFLTNIPYFVADLRMFACSWRSLQSQAAVLKTGASGTNLFYSGLIGLKSFEHLMGEFYHF